jgi:hypothetical protein
MPRSDNAPTARPTNGSARVPRVLPWLLLAAGSALRLAWPLDMEWKFDEKWMFAKAQRIAHGSEALPWIGMPSGVGLQNPGLSIWPFACLARLTHDPVHMTELVQLLNVLVLWGFAFWVHSTWPREDRELGLWGVALFAVSPLPVLFARKIWAQDLLPLFVLPWLWSHSRRERPLAAFAWGLLGALLGQLHMSGFFAAAALFMVSVATDRKRFPWRPWLLGSALGALLLIPWLSYLLSPAAQHASTGRVLSLKFFSEALSNAWGLGLRYPLGRTYNRFLAGPALFGVATHLGALARYGLLGLLVLSAGLLVRERKTLATSAWLRGYFWTIALGGLLLTAAGVQVYAHYLIVWSPLLHVLAVWLVFRRRALLLALCGAQLFLTASFLLFIHREGGVADADYGVAYRAQSIEQRRPLP